jgi:poly-gamma-glutamate synthesis protein (capsule biosynthesis protein)
MIPAQKEEHMATTTSDLSILIAGDFAPIYRVEQAILCGKSEQVFNDVLPLLKAKDLSIINLECPLTLRKNPIGKIGPHLAADPKCAEALRHARFDVATLANNHIGDHGYGALVDTLHACETNGVKTVGAGRNIEEASTPLYLTVKDTRVGIINVAEVEFGFASPTTAGSNPLDIVETYWRIVEAKKNADVVIIIVHGGHESYALPSPRMVRTYRFFAAAGASAVVGHHTHCPSGYEVFHGVPIFYSLGNFVFDWPTQKVESWYEGYLVKLDFRDRHFDNLQLIPYYQCKNGASLNLMTGKEKEVFLGTIKRYSEFTGDSSWLLHHWKKHAESVRVEYLSTILGLNRAQRFLLQRGFLHLSTFKRRRLYSLLNMLRCDAHRDLSIEALRHFLED